MIKPVPGISEAKVHSLVDWTLTIIKRTFSSQHLLNGIVMHRSLSSPYTVMLLDDHEVVRHGVAMSLSREADIEVIGSFGNSRELFEALALRPADIVLVDYALSPSEVDGFNLIRALKTRYPETRSLVLSAHHNPATAALTLQAGSRGFISKTQGTGELIQAIRMVALGDVYMHPSMKEEVGKLSKVSSSKVVDPGEGEASLLIKQTTLSPREREVLRCFLEGMSVTEVAEKFSRSANTISTQKQSAYRKLGIRTDSELFKLHHQLRE